MVDIIRRGSLRHRYRHRMGILKAVCPSFYLFDLPFTLYPYMTMDLCVPAQLSYWLMVGIISWISNTLVGGANVQRRELESYLQSNGKKRQKENDEQENVLFP
jgi:hypothetical protein